jgi:amino acid transporter
MPAPGPPSTARGARTNGWFPGAGRPRGGHGPGAERPIGTWAFAGVAIASLGGPLALAALIVPSVLEDAITSGGLATLAAAVVFVAPLAIWLRYVGHLRASADPTRPGAAGGLYTFVREAVGPRIALVQAAVWTLSYLLYIVYTTIQIVYDLLPQVLPGEARYQTVLALAIPVAVAATMIAGRTAALVVIGAVAASQLVLGGILDGVTVAHLSFPLSSFGASASAGSFAKGGAQTSLLYICAGLPLFLGGELAAPARTTRRVLIGAYLVTIVIVLLAVAPLAAAPGLARTDVPGVELAAQFSSTGLARAMAIGVAVSIAGVILCEYLAVTRLAAAIGGWATRRVSIAVGVIVVAAAPITLIDPDGIYNVLSRVSVAALWVSQLMVFAVFPRFAARRGLHPGLAWALTAVASALAVYGLYLAVIQPSS